MRSTYLHNVIRVLAFRLVIQFFLECCKGLALRTLGQTTGFNELPESTAAFNGTRI